MTSIRYFLEKIKGFRGSGEREHLLIATVLILVAIASFSLGRMSVTLQASDRPASTTSVSLENHTDAATQDSRVVGSKNSDKYHFLWCSGASRISEINKIWFNSKQEAEAAGYKLAANCPEL